MVRGTYLHSFGHFVTLISEPHNQVLQLPVTTSGKKKRKKISQSDYCWKYISLYVTFPWSYSLT